MIFSISAKISSYKSPKSPVFVFFQQKIAILIQKSLPLYTQIDLTRRSTKLTLNSTKTCEKAGKSKISALETHYFYYKCIKRSIT
jgi:hypothetical protein